jgi:hypothetical protein
VECRADVVKKVQNKRKVIVLKQLKKLYCSWWFPRILYRRADGGANSGVTGCMLIEWKPLFSCGFLYFRPGTREAFHNHAFNAMTWWLSGRVTEILLDGVQHDYTPSAVPKVTTRACYHKVVAHEPAWAFTVRGPWRHTWNEMRNGQEVTLTHGRQIVTKG